MRRRTPRRCGCPRRKRAENGHSKQEDKEPYVLENLHREHSLHQALALRVITSPPRSVKAHACSSKNLLSAKKAQLLFAHWPPTLVSPSSRTMSESPSASAVRIARPSDDQDTRRAMKVARSPKSVI